ncbi:MAG: undecaprenyl diphosphate synthase family protein [Erythrobacter sp.]
MHLAIIMDGNGRWASARALLRTAGHLRGASVARRLIEWATEAHLSALTLYTFSTENSARPSMEIDTIFRLIAKYIERNVGRLVHRNVNVTFTAISARSDLAHCSPPDLIVRTGGDRRLSNFLLWHAAYSELTFTDTLWPDFAQSELKQILSDSNRRDRRFGAVSRCQATN